MRPSRLAFSWGVIIGTGFLTKLVLPAALYALAAVSVAQPSVLMLYGVWLTYGVVRGGAIAVASALVTRAGVRGREGLVFIPGIAVKIDPLVTSLVILAGAVNLTLLLAA